MMKSADAPRRIYVRNGVTHVCFAGKTFAPVNGETKLDLDGTVTIEEAEADPKVKRAQVILTQKKKGQATKTETWRSVKVPRTARTSAEA